MKKLLPTDLSSPKAWSDLKVQIPKSVSSDSLVFCLR